MKGLKKLLISGLTSLLIGISSISNAQESALNPFFRPNVISTNYYGSGDVNDDGNVDEVDLDLMRRGVMNDFTNVSGDRTKRDLDYQLLEDHINNGTMLPGNWNNFQTREQREDWFKKMIKIDKTDEKQGILNVWDCHHFATQTHLNFFGYAGERPEIFDIEDNGRFNLPVYYVHITKKEPPNHAINAILTGDNPLDFNDWYFFEPQTDYPIHIGMWDMPENSEIGIMNIKEFFPGSIMFRPYLLIDFELEKDNPKLTYQNPDLILNRENPSAVEEQKPLEFVLSQNYPNPFNANTTIEYNLNKAGKIELEIYDITGRKLETLVNDYQNQGRHIINWNGDKYSSGIYLYQLRNEDKVENKRMLLVK